jgi:hypothetical protein
MFRAPATCSENLALGNTTRHQEDFINMSYTLCLTAADSEALSDSTFQSATQIMVPGPLKMMCAGTTVTVSLYQTVNASRSTGTLIYFVPKNCRNEGSCPRKAFFQREVTSDSCHSLMLTKWQANVLHTGALMHKACLNVQKQPARVRVP